LLPNHDLDQVAKGDARYVIRYGQNVAQGDYGKWIDQWRAKQATRPIAPGASPVGAQKWNQATD
jgi:hypothetical protein